MTGPRALKEPGDPLWCWQTISALQTQWKSLNLDLDLYMRTWDDAEKHLIWDTVPYDKPYGSREQMIKSLEIGDVPEARARVAQRAMDSRPIVEDGTNRYNKRGATGAAHLIARIARDRPDIWERMKVGGFASVAAAAREAGILTHRPKKVLTLSDNLERVAKALKNHYSDKQLRQIREAIEKDEG